MDRLPAMGRPRRWWSGRVGHGLCGATLGAALIGGCNVILGYDEGKLAGSDAGAEGGSGTTTSTGGAAGQGGTAAGTTTGTVTTTGTSTGGASPCQGTVNFGAGETGACQVCIAEFCCDEYLACAQGSCDDVRACALPGGSCGAECFYEICDSGFGYAILKGCADCEGTNCCEQYKDCLSDQSCSDCITGTDGACANTTLDENVNNCSSTSCWEACSGIGVGGAGGN